MNKFEIVKDEHRKNYLTTPTAEIDERIVLSDGSKRYVPEIKLPEPSTISSAGSDFYVPIKTKILPGHSAVVWTDIKAKINEGEVLLLFIRSSLAIKKGLILTNQVGVIDADYYNNPDNDGNIGIAITNTSGTVVTIEAGDKIAQGICIPFIPMGETATTNKRKGGIGSTGN